MIVHLEIPCYDLSEDRKGGVLVTSIISQNFKKYRKEKGLTQDKVAQALFITPQAVSKWERGESLPDISLVPEIAKLFSVSISDLWLEGKDSNESTIVVKEEIFENTLKEIEQMTHINELTSGFDFLIPLTKHQKEQVMLKLLRIPGSDFVVEDFYIYLPKFLKEKLIEELLTNKRLIALESLIPLMTRDIRTNVLERVLKKQYLDFLEEMMPFLNYTQKEMIIAEVLNHRLPANSLENYVTFFTEKQRQYLLNYEED